MADIDERVVEMKFNNQQFEAGTKQSLSTLDKLKAGLNLDGATRSLSGLQDVADRFHLGGIADGVDTIAGKFTALGIAGVTALANIANRAVDAGIQLAKSLTVDPVKAGLDEYTTNLNSIQTVLSNTQSSGATLKDVNSTLNELNTYSDKTIYNFSEMARNVGTFTAAGVGLKPATAAIKGIANLAALSGSNSQQASTAMYQLSQAISAGKVGLQDWNSVVNAGMGGTVFQRALARTAVNMGTLKDSALKLTGPMKNVSINGESFRNSISAAGGKGTSWLTSEVLTKTLAQFTGDLSDADLAAQGFSKTSIKAIQDQAKLANEAATVVKTLPQLISTLQESAGSGWSQTFQYIFGDFDEAKKLFTNINNVLGGMIGAQAKARNKMLAQWHDLGGRDSLIQGVANAFHALMNIIGPVQKAFRSIFPATTSTQLFAITKAFENFTQMLAFATASVGPQIERTFKGIFAVLDIGRFIVVEVLKTFFSLFGELGTGGAGVLDITANIGDFLVALHDAIVNGDGFTNVLKIIGDVLRVPIVLISNLVGFLGSLAQGLSDVRIKAFGNEAGDAAGKITPLQRIMTLLSTAVDKIKERFDGFDTAIGPVLSKIGTIFGDVTKNVIDGIANIDYNKALTAVQTGFFGVLTLILGKSFAGSFIKKEKKGFLAGLFEGFDVGGGTLASIKEMFNGVTDSLKSMQNNLKSKTLLNIAVALGILTASMIALSLIDSKRLAAASVAMGVMFAELGATMKVMSGIANGPGIKNIPAMALGLILLSVAVSILAKAVVTLAQLDWNELARGLTGLAFVLVALVATSKALGAKEQTNLIRTGLALIPFAIGIKILGSALADLSGLSWGDMAVGLTGIAGVLTSLALYAKFAKVNKQAVAGAAGLLILGIALKVLVSALSDFATLGGGKMAGALLLMSVALAAVTVALRAMPKNMLVSGIAMVTVATALKLMGESLKSFAGLKPEAAAQGIGVLALSLFIMVTALNAMEGSLPGAAALLVAAAAINVMVPALQALGAMDIEAIGKALGVLAASLIIIAGSLYLMTGALPGAAALVVAAAALLLLAPALAIMGSIPLAGIGVALLALAGVFVVLGVGALALAAIVPVLLLLGAAILLIGAGVGLAAGGIGALVIGLGLLGTLGTAGIGVLMVALGALLAYLPTIAKALGTAIISFADAIGDGAPQLIDAFVKVLTSMLDGIDKVAPHIIETGTKLISTFLDSIGVLIPKVVDTGLKIIQGVLKGIADHIGGITENAIRIVVNFVNAIAKKLPSVIQAGVNLVLKFVNGISDAIDKNSEAMGRAGGRLAGSIVTGMVKGIGAGVRELVGAVLGMGGAALNAIKLVLGIHSPSKEFYDIGTFVTQGFVDGIKGTKDQVDGAFQQLKDQLADFVNSSQRNIDEYTDKVGDLKAQQKKDTADVKAAQNAVTQATTDRKKGTSAAIHDEKVKLNSLIATRKKDTRELKDANAAVKDAKTAKARKNAQDRVQDLTAKRKKDTKAITAQQKVIAKITKDTKNGVYLDEAKDKLAKLQRAQRGTNRDLADAQLALNNATTEAPKAAAAQKVYNDMMGKYQTRLDELAVSNDDLNTKIENQQKIYDDAKKTMDDYNQSLQDQYGSLQDISSDTTVDDYFTNLQNQITKVNEFSTKLQTLRNEGLNDEAYKKLLSEGVDATPFIDDLISKGQDGVTSFNGLITQLNTAATNVGNTASSSLYAAGVNSALGYLNGYKDQQTANNNEIAAITQTITDAVNKALGIKSPSRVFAEIGKYTMQGFALGIQNTSGTAKAAAVGVGNDTVATLRDTMSNLGSAISLSMDTTPTIRPVLDLTQVQKDASQIGGMLGTPGVSVDSTFNSANAAANGYDDNQAAMMSVKGEVATSTTTIFNQTNNSPKALNNAEVYRQTNNQLSRAKKEG